MELPSDWGTAEYEILDITNFNTYDKPTVVSLILTGFIRGVDYVSRTTLICNSKTFNDLAEEIISSVLYPWVGTVLQAQDAEVV